MGSEREQRRTSIASTTLRRPTTADWTGVKAEDACTMACKVGLSTSVRDVVAKMRFRFLRTETWRDSDIVEGANEAESMQTTYCCARCVTGLSMIHGANIHVRGHNGSAVI